MEEFGRASEDLAEFLEKGFIFRSGHEALMAFDIVPI
jgi:hypothetical protein